MSKLYRHTFYEVYITREAGDPLPGTAEGGISAEEWRSLVADDEDLQQAANPTFANGQACKEPAWQFKSYPEGTPILFEEGRVFIREDDSATIERLTELAKKLQARVVGEDGSEFFDIKETPATAQPPSGGSVRAAKMPIDEELIRKRQAALAFVVFLVFPIYVVWRFLQGENPGELWLWGLGSAGMAAFALSCLLRTKYYLSWPGGDTAFLHVLDPKSTNDRIVQKEIAYTQLDPLELVWFPLEYPGKQRVEYHVRAQQLPWLVLYATSNKEKAVKALRKCAAQLVVNAADRSAAEAANNVPKKYLLTEEEKGKKKR